MRSGRHAAARGRVGRAVARALAALAAACGAADSGSDPTGPTVHEGEAEGERGPAPGACVLDRPSNCRGAAASGAIRFEDADLGAIGVPARDSLRRGINDCVALSDVDGDGALDLLVRDTPPGTATGQRATVLWGDAGGWFQGSTSQDIDASTDLGGCLVADLDADGRRDIVIAAGSVGPPLVLRQSDHRRFERVGWLDDVGRYSFRALAAAHIDGDALPDLYVGMVDAPPPFGDCGEAIQCEVSECDMLCYPLLQIVPDAVLLNGGQGRFSDAAASLGIVSPYFPNSVAVADLNGDRRPDFIVGNDYGPNPMFFSQGPDAPYLRDEQAWGMAPYNHAMGLAVADFDNDGAWDLYITDAGPDQIYFQDGGRLTRCESDLGIGELTREHFGWGVVAEDFDNDGDVDLYVTSSVVADPGRIDDVASCAIGVDFFLDNTRATDQVDYLMENCGDRTFDLRPWPLPADRVPMIQFSPSSAADLDGDGGVDIVENYPPRSLRVMRNVSEGRGRWLQLDLAGEGAGWEALGAVVEVAAGGATMRRQVQAMADGGQEPTRVHFGLGEATSARVTVRWPSGKDTACDVVEVDRIIAIEEGGQCP